MTDIVNELRQRVTDQILLSKPFQYQKDELCQRADDEIERLRAALETREAQVIERNAVIMHIYNACDHYLRSGKNIEVEQ